MPFFVFTNHLDSKVMRTKAKLTGQLWRFAEKLSAYNYAVAYCPGKKNFSWHLLLRVLLLVSPDVEHLMAHKIKEAARRNRLWMPPT